MGAPVDFLLLLTNDAQPTSHRSFRSLDSPNNRQSLPLHNSSLPPVNGVGRTHDTAGYLKDGPRHPASVSLKRVRSQEDSFAYDPTPSGDDGDQPKEDTSRAKAYVSTFFVLPWIV